MRFATAIFILGQSDSKCKGYNNEIVSGNCFGLATILVCRSKRRIESSPSVHSAQAIGLVSNWVAAHNVRHLTP